MLRQKFGVVMERICWELQGRSCLPLESVAAPRRQIMVSRSFSNRLSRLDDLHAAVAAQKTPVEWVVVDASPINIIDVTGLRKLDELRVELAAEGVSVYYARVKRHLERFFNSRFAQERRTAAKSYRFQTLKPAIRAFLKYQQAKGQAAVASDADQLELDATHWREPVQAPRKTPPELVSAPLQDVASSLEPGKMAQPQQDTKPT